MVLRDYKTSTVVTVSHIFYMPLTQFRRNACYIDYLLRPGRGGSGAVTSTDPDRGGIGAPKYSGKKTH